MLSVFVKRSIVKGSRDVVSVGQAVKRSRDVVSVGQAVKSQGVKRCCQCWLSGQESRGQEMLSVLVKWSRVKESRDVVSVG